MTSNVLDKSQNMAKVNSGSDFFEDSAQWLRRCIMGCRVECFVRNPMFKNNIV